MSQKHLKFISIIKSTVLNYYIFFLFCCFVCFILLIIQAILLASILGNIHVITPEFVNNYFILNYTEVNTSSMYFANFFHSSDPQQIYENIIFFLIACFLVAIFHCLATSESIIYNESQTGLILKSALLIFILLPLPISGMSIYFGRIIGSSGAIGFSGIVSAFWGFSVYSLYIITRSQKAREVFSDFKLLSLELYKVLPVVLLAFILGVILLTNINSETNYPGHIVGLFLGIIFPYFYDVVKKASSFEKRAVVISIFIVVYLTSSFIWIFI